MKKEGEIEVEGIEQGRKEGIPFVTLLMHLPKGTCRRGTCCTTRDLECLQAKYLGPQNTFLATRHGFDKASHMHVYLMKSTREIGDVRPEGSSQVGWIMIMSSSREP